MSRIRIITGLIVAGGWLLLLFYGPFWLFWLVFLALGGLALNEYYNMTLARFAPFDHYTGILLGLFPLLAAYEGGVSNVWCLASSPAKTAETKK